MYIAFVSCNWSSWEIASMHEMHTLDIVEIQRNCNENDWCLSENKYNFFIKTSLKTLFLGYDIDWIIQTSTKCVKKSNIKTTCAAYILFATNEKDKDLKGIVIDVLKSILCNYTWPWYHSSFCNK